MNPDESLRKHLADLLTGGQAHVDFEAAIAGLPEDLRGARHPVGLAHPWQLLEHLRIAQWDILEFSRDAAHTSPDFPEGYWPRGDAPPDPAAWDRTLDAFRADLKAMIALVRDPAVNLHARIPHGGGQTVLREALLVVDHNAYHIGQMVTVRKLLGAWDG